MILYRIKYIGHPPNEFFLPVPFSARQFNNCSFMETSAKAKIGVKDVSFICLCMILKIAFLILYPSDICGC